MQVHISTNNCSPSKTICYEAYFSSSHCHGSQPFFLDPSVTAFVETEEHTYAVAQPVRLVKPEPKEGVRGKRLTSERIALDDDGVNSVDQDTVPDKKRLPTNQHLPYTTG